MFLRVFKRLLRGVVSSTLGLVVAKWGNNPIYGPAVTGLLLGLDKMLREKLVSNGSK